MSQLVMSAEGCCHLLLLLVYGLCSEIHRWLTAASSTDRSDGDDPQLDALAAWFHRQSRKSRWGCGMLSGLLFRHFHSAHGSCCYFDVFHPVTEFTPTLPLSFFFCLTVSGLLQVCANDLSTALTSDIQYFKGDLSTAYTITSLSHSADKVFLV